MSRTHMCIVTPQVRKSFTRRTLLITSRPRSSKTKTFHIGSPSELSMGAEGATIPLLVALESWIVSLGGVLLRFRIFSMEARVSHQYYTLCRRANQGDPYRSVDLGEIGEPKPCFLGKLAGYRQLDLT